ncbi:MAG: NEW3 domain-containing protein, partial [Candidatus Hydrogenedentes bacterium]|nr:NEW3 domain-containing protein [Candidatus Hydrogenedentota bacterium]
EVHGLGELGNHKIHAPMHKTGSAEGDFAITIPQRPVQTLPLAPRLFSADFLVPQIAVDVQINCGDAVLYLTAPVYLDVAPPVSIACPDAPYLIRTTTGQARTVRLLLTNNSAEPLAEYLALTVPNGWTSKPERLPISFAKEGEQRFVSFVVTAPQNLKPGDYPVYAQIVGAKQQQEILLRVVDVAVPESARVGVIQSYDDTFIKTLKKVGVAHETLAISDYIPERLDTFTAIIVDIRAYQYRPDLVANNSVLLDYVARGGTLLVMYQKTFDWQEDFAPYPITLSRNRVTREDAPVSVLVPEHPLFTTPNLIAERDWLGWIQERGLYFPSQWNDAYTPLVMTQDPGEEIPAGSYLVASHGEGYYVYSALGWYRQLRELHPGSLRCFANMLALRGKGKRSD